MRYLSASQKNRDPVIVSVLSSLRKDLSSHYGDRLIHLILFGSHARDEATLDSDIDVLVVLKDPLEFTVELHRTSKLIADLCLEHNVLVSRMFMTNTRFINEQSPLLRNIRNEGLAFESQGVSV
jgi:uncharacterized protein